MSQFFRLNYLSLYYINIIKDNVNILDTPTMALKRPRPISPPEVHEDCYKEMLVKHRKRQLYDDYDDEVILTC